MVSKHIKKVIEHYTPNVRKDAPGYKILDWSSGASQKARYEVLREEIAGCGLGDGCSLLDVGCGLGELAGYLTGKGLAAGYVGVDISPAVLEEGRRRSPGLDLRHCDVFATPPVFPKGGFDAVFCSGIFTLKQDNSLDFARRGLVRLVEMSSRLTVANFLHARTALQYDICVYFEPSEIVSALEPLGVKAVIRDDYLENDFSIIVKKE